MPRDPYAVRREMAVLGWISSDSLTWMGWGVDLATRQVKYGYRIQFDRWDWHGKPCDRAAYGAGTADLTTIPEVVEEAAALALRAWAGFPDHAPEADANGNLVPNGPHTKRTKR